jgi:CO/xanthine dehydrogenase Mo-binding subunit
MTLSRRGLFTAAAALTVAFTLPRQARASGKTVVGTEVDAYLAIAPDGTVTIYAGKVDLGTGARIALPQIVADELGASLSDIRLVEGDTDLTPDQGSTGGSTGIPIGGMQIRQAAATAREKLLALAAARLNLPTSSLTASEGAIHAPNASIPFATLLAGQDFALKLDPKAPLKSPANFRFIGRPLPRPDVPAKMTGTHTYVHDLRLPDMLHARIIRPPSPGAELTSLDDSALASIPNARTIRLNNFLAVLAPREHNAIRAAAALKPTWRELPDQPSSDSLYADIRATPQLRRETLSASADPAPILAASPRRLAATYQWPIQSHASMGPSCALADIRADSATIWTASQGTHRLRRTIATALNLPPESVRVIYTDGSGSYGTNGNDDAAIEAALLSRAAAAPVRVQWTRADEHGWDPKGPAHITDLQASLDASGNIEAWHSLTYLPANTPNLPGLPLLALDAAGIPQPQGITAGQLAGNADAPYAIPAAQADIAWLKTTPLRPSNLRAPGKIANVFAVESFLDELAAAAQADPLAYRLARMKHPRGAEVLRRVGEAMNWQPRPSPARTNAPILRGPILHGRGIAYVNYKQAENYIAMGMEIAITQSTGAIRIERVVCAHDCGLIINPDTVRAQVEGCILQTISRTLFEEVTFAQGRVTSTDWSTYPILTMPDVPKLDIILIDRPTERPLGAGEAAAAPVAAAIGNAIFDATGIRLRTVPLTPARMKAALTQGA